MRHPRTDHAQADLRPGARDLRLRPMLRAIFHFRERHRPAPPELTFMSRDKTRRVFNHSRSTVNGSSSPLKYFSKASLKTWLSDVTLAKRVIDDRNFRLSGYPNIWFIERLCTLLTSCVHSLSRDPRMGCSRYASASCRDEIPNLFAISLCPRPRS